MVSAEPELESADLIDNCPEESWPRRSDDRPIIIVGFWWEIVAEGGEGCTKMADWGVTTTIGTQPKTGEVQKGIGTYKRV